MRRRHFSRPWWLEDGTERCPVCHHMYLYETEHRCPDCDGAVCSNCGEQHRKVCLPSLDEDELVIDIEI